MSTDTEEILEYMKNCSDKEISVFKNGREKGSYESNLNPVIVTVLYFTTDNYLSNPSKRSTEKWNYRSAILPEANDLLDSMIMNNEERLENTN